MPFGVRGLPGVVLVDEQGSITQIEFVAIDSYEQLRDLVEKHLDVSLS
jgi:thioredoxin-like negative regulator of GroEL